MRISFKMAKTFEFSMVREPEEDILGLEIENSYLRTLLQVLRLPSTDLKPRKTQDDDKLFGFA